MEMEDRPKCLIQHGEILFKGIGLLGQACTYLNRVYVDYLTKVRYIIRPLIVPESKCSLKDKIRLSLILSNGKSANPKLSPGKIPEALKGFLRASCGSVRGIEPQSRNPLGLPRTVS
jgi:hypothetical protein